jgi:hypothetical protein
MSLPKVFVLVNESTQTVLFVKHIQIKNTMNIEIIILVYDTHLPCLRRCSYMTVFVFPFIMYENMAK